MGGFRPVLIASVLAMAMTAAVSGVELAPDDPSIAGSLAVWLRDPGIDYDPAAGLWSDSSGNGLDASVVADGGVAFEAPALQPLDGGDLAPGELMGVHFAGEKDDLLATPSLNNGDGLSELTIIAVYSLDSVEGNASLTRPVGLGSVAGTGANPGNHFNLASDPSIRKDNGSVTGRMRNGKGAF